MKWLIISDDETLSKKIETFLNEKNRKDKVYSAPITIQTLKTYKKYFSELAACIMYTKDVKSIEPSVGSGLCAIFGYFAAANIPVITNNCFLYEDYLFGKDIGIGCKDAEDLFNTLSKKLN